MYTYVVYLRMPNSYGAPKYRAFHQCASNHYCARKLVMLKYCNTPGWWVVKLKTWGP